MKVSILNGPILPFGDVSLIKTFKQFHADIAVLRPRTGEIEGSLCTRAGFCLSDDRRPKESEHWTGLIELSELQIAGRQIRSIFEDGNDATITKAFVWAIFLEVEPAFLLVVEEVKVLLGKSLLDRLLVFVSSEGGKAVDAEAVGIDFKGICWRIEGGYFVCWFASKTLRWLDDCSIATILMLSLWIKLIVLRSQALGHWAHGTRSQEAWQNIWMFPVVPFLEEIHEAL